MAKFKTFIATANQSVYTKEGHKPYIQGLTKGRPPADLSTWTKNNAATKLLRSDKLVTITTILRTAGAKVRGRPLGSKGKAKVEAVATGKRRGRPPGSKNKVKAVEPALIVAQEPILIVAELPA